MINVRRHLAARALVSGSNVAVNLDAKSAGRLPRFFFARLPVSATTGGGSLAHTNVTDIGPTQSQPATDAWP